MDKTFYRMCLVMCLVLALALGVVLYRQSIGREEFELCLLV